MKTAFISGHLDLTWDEFIKHYVDPINKALEEGCSFVVGDAPGADSIAQGFLYMRAKKPDVTIYHAYQKPRNNIGFRTVGGYTNQTQKDKAMTIHSDFDIAWVRPGKEESGTARNLKRRKEGLIKVTKHKIENR
jgi:hypothetical protein